MIVGVIILVSVFFLIGLVDSEIETRYERMKERQRREHGDGTMENRWRSE